MARYNDEIIEEIRNSNDIVDVISQYVVLKRSGRNFQGLCPFHGEKSPSFFVLPDRQFFHCFGCGIGGDVIKFVRQIENLDFIPTLELLASRAGITLPALEGEQDNSKIRLKEKVYEINRITAEYYHENLYKPTAKAAQDYVKKRKMDNNTLKTFLIGYAGNYDELYKYLQSKGFKNEEILESGLVAKTQNGKFYDRYKNRLMIPIRDIQDRFIGFGGRVLDDSKPKYINSPENVVYSKRRELFALNIAKKSMKDKILIVEGYMDAISLHQRGINNVVASLGTALTEQQGRLLRKYASQVIIGYDADGAGQAATIRGMEILQNLGCDIRILQLDGEAKDPDEYILKYGSGRLQKRIDEAISLVEFKIKLLKNSMKIETSGDKIKFLNEIIKILSKVENVVEREVYIDNISKEYGISKEAIYAQSNKLMYANNQSSKNLQKPLLKKNKDTSKNKDKISETVIKRENMIISLLINYPNEAYEPIKQKISLEAFKDEKNKKIAKVLYEQLEKGNSNNILNQFEDEELVNHITYIMAYDFQITDVKRAIEDMVSIYEKERLIEEKNDILRQIENKEIGQEEQIKLEERLNELIIKLARMK